MRTSILVVLAGLAASAGAHADPAQHPDSDAGPRDPSRVGAAEGLMVLGAAGVITGVTLGFVARSEYHHAFDVGECLSETWGNACDPAGYDQTRRATTLGNVGTAFGVAGAALAIGGAIVYLTAPRLHGIAPVVSRDSAGLALAGHF